ncbi:MAG TPA: Na+/H+ antiporter NhaC family protein [Trichocoleus sp.]|jgi:NhaC family Na+:H+ antiporter
MDILFALASSFILLVFSVSKGYFVAYPLFVTLGILVVVLRRRGFTLKYLFKLIIDGSKKSFSVLNILLLIGAVTAVWMAAGTVPAIVYYGIQLIHPKLFILSAFLLTSFVSFLIGTSFGAASTIGVALMIMAKGSNVNPHLIAGAIIGGAYWGDRCSPMSSSANLIASITATNLYQNIRNMLVTAWLPLGISCIIYLIFSWFYPVQITDSSLLIELNQLFDLHWVTLLPAIVILVLAVFRVEVKLSMLFSIIVSVLIALFLQHYRLTQLIQFIYTGFQLEQNTQIRSILLGGGILSMLKVSVIVLISTAISGLLSGTAALKIVEKFLRSIHSRSHLFSGTTLIGTGAAAFGCTQTIAILLTQELVSKKYEQVQLTADYLATDLENTVVVISPLIPWNIAGLVPATILMTDSGFIPFACYLYLIPLCNWLLLRSGKDWIQTEALLNTPK